MQNRIEGTDMIEQVLGWSVIVLGAALAGGLGFTITEGNPILTLLSAAGGAAVGGMALQRSE